MSTKSKRAAKRGKADTAEDFDHRTRTGAARRAKTRARILDAAAHVFAEKGADMPVIDDFLLVADVSRGTFYNHFRTTGELLDATIAWLSDDIVQVVDPEVSLIEDDAVRLATAMRLYLTWAASNRRWCAFMAKIPRLGLIAERRAKRDLHQGRATGVLQYQSIDAALDFIVGASQQTIRRMADASRTPDYLEEVVGMILRGLGVPPKRIEEIISEPLPASVRPAKSRALFKRKKA